MSKDSFTYPAFVEVFGDDGELHFISAHDAGEEALEDAIQVLEDRVTSIRKDIKALRHLLAQKRVKPVPQIKTWPLPSRPVSAIHVDQTEPDKRPGILYRFPGGGQ